MNEGRVGEERVRGRETDAGRDRDRQTGNIKQDRQNIIRQ